MQTPLFTSAPIFLQSRRIQVGRSEAQRARPVDGEKHVREHRPRALTLGDPLHARDELQQVLLRDR